MFWGKIDSKKKKFIIKTKSKAYEKDNIKIYRFGRITDIFVKEKLGKSDENQNETIFRLYKKYGPKFIKKLEGYFFIVLVDKKKDEIFFFNNRYSNTTCYYYVSDEQIIFSDSMKGLLGKLDKKPDINKDIISLFLNSGYSYSEKTNFKNIFRMIPGYYMRIKKGKIHHKKYYDMTFNRKEIKNIDRALDKYENLWQEAISNFTNYNNTKTLGSALSGGLDTSWVVINATKVFKKKIHTYTCFFEHELHNELEEARFVTEKTGNIHHKVPVKSRDLDLMPEMIRIAEEPVLSTALPMFKLIRQANKDGIDVLLSGDGGNNIYHHLYPVSEVNRYIKYIPHQIRRLLFRTVDSLAKITGWEMLWELRYPLIAFSRKDYDNFYRNLVCYRHFDPQQRKKLLKPEFRQEFDENSMLNQIKLDKDNFDNELIRARFIYGNMQYVSTFHEKFLKHHNMLLFPPYQSKEIIDFLTSLPFDIMYRGNTFQKLTNRANKMYFQKLALKRYLPEEFVDTTGQAFDQPYHDILERRPKVVNLLFKRLKKRGWYNEEYLDRLYEEHKKQKQHDKIICELKNHGYRIMTLLSLEIWATEFLDKNPLDWKEINNISLEKYLRNEK